MTEAVLTQAPDAPEVGRTGDAIGRRGPDPRASRYVELFDTTQRPAEPAWLSAFRRAGMSRFDELGFPTTKNEDWHFTNIAPLAERAFSPAALANKPSESAVTAEDIEPFLFAGDWQTLVFVNGHFAPDLSHSDAADDRMYVGRLASAINDEARASDIERHLGGLSADHAHAFTALNSAFMQDGVVIMARGDAVAGRPIHVVFVTASNADGALVSPRNLIVLDHHAEATVVESYVSIGETSHFTNAVTEMYIGEGARLRHYKIQRESASAYHVASSYAHQGRGSNYEAFSFAAGADLSRTNVATVLDGEGAHVTLNGLYMVDGEQLVDHQTRIEHAKESCTSHEIYKGVLDDDSHAVFNGQVYVRPEAQKTDGKQSNNNLLLSAGARVDTKPQLEIYADDVKCTHGATIGRLDPTALFYLKSRGIGEETSRKLLTYAFAAEVLEELTVEAVRDKLESLAFLRFAAAV
ncbi:MAG: Fe-S cluster assembly protein SufD [Gemmatimonadaceae bacterium]